MNSVMCGSAMTWDDPVEITMDIYTNDTARRLGIRCCEVRYAQAEEDRYRYNVKDDRERFVMTVK